MQKQASDVPTKASRTPRRRKPGFESERKFLDSANSVFWEYGFAGSTIMQIVEDSNLSVGSFYHRFNGKEELLAAALEGVFADFEKVLPKFDHSIEKNQNLYTLFYRLSVVGRGFVARHRGIYRAASEIARSDFEKLGVLAKISVAIADHISNEMGSYADQLGPRYKPVQVRHAVQLLAMTTMQSELGMGPLFPEEIPEYANTISRAMCGILDYTGKPILIET